MNDWQQIPGLVPMLGPRYDQSSCAGCHREALDHRRTPSGSSLQEPLRIARLFDTAQATRYGAQFTRHAIAAKEPERRVQVEFTSLVRHYADGTRYELLQPETRLHDGQTWIDAHDTGLRVAPALFGWGLLETISDELLLTLADPGDHDNDGISGRVNRVESFIFTYPEKRVGAGLGVQPHTSTNSASMPAPNPVPVPFNEHKTDALSVIGRFGWKAEQPTLRSQTAAALFNDMGVTSALQPTPGCTPLQARTACDYELDATLLDAIVEYLRHVSVPDQRNRHKAETQRGARLFTELGCNGCHIPVMRTPDNTRAEHSRQVVWPYSDLLLHDMGEALADPPDDKASAAHYNTGGDTDATVQATTMTIATNIKPDRDGIHTLSGPPTRREWRTPPLWGAGLLEARPDHRFLHDGRACTLLEAVLWHGGEAAGSRNAVVALPARARADLAAFLRSL